MKLVHSIFCQHEILRKYSASAGRPVELSVRSSKAAHGNLLYDVFEPLQSGQNTSIIFMGMIFYYQNTDWKLLKIASLIRDTIQGLSHKSVMI